MNRRDLFKKAGKLGAGLGLAAVVGKGVVPEADDELDWTENYYPVDSYPTAKIPVNDGNVWVQPRISSITTDKLGGEQESLAGIYQRKVDGAIARKYDEMLTDMAGTPSAVPTGTLNANAPLWHAEKDAKGLRWLSWSEADPATVYSVPVEPWERLYSRNSSPDYITINGVRVPTGGPYYPINTETGGAL